ncbi:hypothetical protein EVG20_g3097 [Dentipellis fragilis]|uniref:Uncharacterized protein n=1 Tax=Dentipellis fragilis TaxID=205917 RepID=A0A4Y9Z6E0_9AGAM|nr:hypothetical protein EVG20_g3097 [Dentipellis fragilis]
MSSVTSVFPTAPTTSSPLPSSSSSGGVTSSGNGTNTASVMLFGFIIVIIVVIGAFLIGGFLWHRIRMQRHARIPGMLQYDEQTGGYTPGSPPPLYEVWADDEKLEGKGEWATLVPISVTIEETVQVDTASVSPEPEKSRSWLHPFHHRNTRTPSGEVITATDSMPTANVSFLIAMPSPTRRTTKDAASETSSAELWSQSGEYALGTYQTPFPEGARL